MNRATDLIRVLHVDDEPDFAALAGEFLERQDDRFTVDPATSATEALEKLSEAEYDCIVSDYDMPGQNGIEFLETVRETSAELPFILYTGKGSEEVASEAISRGVSDYLQKESGSDQYAVLANRISNLVSQRQAEANLEIQIQQQRVLGDLGKDALSGAPLDELFDAAVEAVADVLDNEFAKVLEFQPDRDQLALRAGVGWDDGQVGEAAVSAGLESQAGYTLQSETPVVVEDLPAETRFRGPPLLTDHDVRSGVSVMIGIVSDPWGVFGTHSTDRKTFSDSDVTFVDNVANLLGIAIDRTVRERKLEQLRARMRSLSYTETTAETVQRAVEAADEVIGAPLSGIHLLNEAGTALEPNAVMEDVHEVFDTVPHFDRDAPPGTRAALVWEAYRGDGPVHYDELSTLERLTEETPTESLILHPLGDRGVFIVSSPEPAAFDETDVLLVEIFSNNLEAALDRVEREQLLRTRQRRLEQLHDATRELVNAKNERAVAQLVVDAAEEILDFSNVVFRLYDSERGGLVPVASTDAIGDLVPDREVFTPEGGSLNWAAFDAGEVRVHDDIEAVEYAADQGTGLRSLMILPIGEYGTLAFTETRPAAFDDNHEYLARILATAAETALQAKEREAQLRAQRDTLERQNDQLDEFAKVISHDIRNPLNVVEGRLAMAREASDNEHLEIASRALQRMRSLIDDILSLARAGEVLGETEPVDLADAAETCWRHIERPSARLVVETDATIQADETRLRQLLENLLLNAADHGGEDITIRVGDLPDGFFVEDDGIGIAEDARDAVFEPGYSTADAGTGFGLTIVRDAAQAHGWEVTLCHGSRGGARFEITGVKRN